MLQLAGVTSKDSYVMPSQDFRDTQVLHRCFHRSSTKEFIGKRIGADNAMDSMRYMVPFYFASTQRMSDRMVSNNKNDEHACCYIDDPEIDSEKQKSTTGEKEVDSGAANQWTSKCQVSVISEGPKRKSSSRVKEQNGAHYVYDPKPIQTKSKKRHVPPEAKNEGYWAQRMKNNISARKSREERRKEEIRLVAKCKSLFDENCRLRQENGFLHAKVKVMESIVFSRLGDKYL